MSSVCSAVQTIKSGDGSKTQFSFDFPYVFKSEIHVYFWNVTTKEYDEILTTDSTYPWQVPSANPTIVEFTGTAPPAPSDATANIKIRRITNIDDIQALFNPGSAIRSDDLNSNFEQLRFAIQESLCPDITEAEVTTYLQNYYWNNFEDTVTSTDTWSSSDTKIATTAAMDARFQDELAETVTSTETWANDDNTIATTAAIDDQIDNAITNDILIDSTGLTKSSSGGQTTLGIGAGSVDLDRIKSDDIVATSAYSSTWTNEDDKVATAGALAARHDVVVNTSVTPPSTAQVGKQWLSTAPGNQVHKIYDGSGWRTVAVGQPYSPATTTVVRYVDVTNGSDASDVTGFLPQAPLQSIGRALELINASSSGDGSLIKVAPGVYQETLPLRIKKNNVSIVGESMRSCFVHPTVATENNDMFEVDSGSYIANLTLLGLKVPTADQGSRNNSLDNDATYGLPSNQPFSVRFRTDVAPVILKSPYIQNCTHFSDAHFDNANFDPNTFPSTDAQTYSAVAGDETSAPCGGGLLIDGAAVSSSSPVRSMVVDAFTQITLDGPGVLVTNNGYAQLVSFFGTFAHYHAKAKNGGQINLSNCVSDFGRYGLIADGKSPSAIATATASAANSGATTITIGAITTAGSFHGTVSRPLDHMMVTIDGVDYGVVSSTANGSGWDIVLTSGLTSNITNTTVSFALRSYISTGGHTFEFVGVGTDYGDHPDNGGVPVEANQVIELNGGKVWQSSTDHVGKFKAGDVLVVDQVSETVNLKATTVTGNLAVTGTVDGRDVAADGTKLDGIESNATGDQTAAEIRTLVESASDSNVFTDADHSKLNAIEANATADQTASEIKTAYESNSNTNAFTDAEKTKLSGIATGAEVNVNADWNATSGDAQILNKPTLYSDSSVDSHLNQSSASANEVLAWNGSDYAWVTQTTGYSNSSVDAHLNQSTASTNEVLSWNGSDYDWVAQASGGLSDIVSDTTPQLGGNLDVNGQDIVSVSNGDIDLDPNGSGVVVFKGNSTKGSGQFKLNCEQNSHGITIKGPPHSAAASYTLTLPNTDGNANEVLKTDGSGNLSWVAQPSAGLSNNTTNTGSIGIGTNALDSDTTGTKNIAIGSNALTDLTDGANNIAIGDNAARNIIGGTLNIAIGTESLDAATTANRNVGVGVDTLKSLTTGDSNVAIGYQSNESNTTGGYNVSVGRNTLKGNLSSSNSTAVGYNALTNNTASNNTAVGSLALQDNTTGSLVVGIGRQALQRNTTGGSNVAVGVQSLVMNTTGSTNTAVGNYALLLNSTASNNTAVGYYSLGANTTGTHNTAIGVSSLESNTTGYDNVACGNALSNNTTGALNTAVGRAALYFNTTASHNTAVGNAALQRNTTGARNTSVGHEALFSNTTANENVAIGRQALYSNTTGSYATIVGYQAGYTTTTAGEITAVGYRALKSTTNYSNVAVGLQALEDVTTGAGNTGVGYRVGEDITTGSSNTLVGQYAGTEITTGASNTALGHNSLYKATTASSTAAVGYASLYNCTGGYNTALGSYAAEDLTTGTNNIIIGYDAQASSVSATNEITLGNANVNKLRLPGMQSSSADGYVLKYNHSNGYISLAASPGISNNSSQTNSLGVGTGALSNDSGNNNTAFGENALDASVSGIQNTAVGSSALTALTTGEYNTAVGMWSGYSLTTGSRNTFFGAFTGYTRTTGDDATHIGYGAGYHQTGSSNTAVGTNALLGASGSSTGSTNTAVGYQALKGTTTGNGNSGIGSGAASSLTTGQNNTYIGSSSGALSTTCSYNVSVGASSLLKNTTGANNTAIGYQALKENTTASYNTCVGYKAGAANVTGNQNTYIGYNAGLSATTSENTVVGYNAANAITTGSSNTVIGRNSLYTATTASSTISIGNSTLEECTTAQGNVCIGDNAGLKITTNGENTYVGTWTASYQTGSNNVAFGYFALQGQSGSSTASNNTAIGYEAGKLVTTGSSNTFIGWKTGDAVTTGFENTFVGHNSGGSVTEGNYNTAVGRQSMPTLTTGSGNVVMGSDAMELATTASNNVAIGTDALKQTTTGTYNTALGRSSGESNTTGGSNVFIGYKTGYSNTTHSVNCYIGDYAGYYALGDGNVAIGYQALMGDSPATTNRYNVAVGNHAGEDVTSGYDNTLIGWSAGAGITTGYNLIVIGKSATPSSNTANEEVTLGNSSISTLRCNTQTISSLSDGRDKTEVEDLPLGLDFIDTLRPVKFKWDTRDGNGKDGSYDAGFIAQDLQSAQSTSDAEYLKMVMDSNPDRLEAAYGQLIPVLVQAIKDLKSEIETLKSNV